MTFITLLIHRVRAARAAQRDRAPEDVVRSLPWLAWNGVRWEKHEGTADLEQGLTQSSQPLPETSPTEDQLDASTSALPHLDSIPWFDSQVECAICLYEFVKDDKIRVLPCHHIFHMEEIDEWLVKRKKVCPVCKAVVGEENVRGDESVGEDGNDVGGGAGEANESGGVSGQTQQLSNERTPLLGNSSTNGISFWRRSRIGIPLFGRAGPNGGSTVTPS